MSLVSKRLLIVSCLAIPPCLASEPTSFYSTIDPKFVADLGTAELEQEKDADVDQFRRICPGYGGYELVHKWLDGRSWIDVRKDGRESDLYEATLRATRSTFPAVVDETIEWRGVAGEKTFRPFAIIYRITGEDTGTEKAFTNLLVVALNGGDPTVLDTVSGKDEHRKARQIADAHWDENGRD